jgi:hypothetical protein
MRAATSATTVSAYARIERVICDWLRYWTIPTVKHSLLPARLLAVMLHVALTIAGSDPIGGAGIQADLKTFHQFGVYGEAVITLLTVQNTVRVTRVDCIPAELVLAQLAAVLEDIPPDCGGSRATVAPRRPDLSQSARG